MATHRISRDVLAIAAVLILAAIAFGTYFTRSMPETTAASTVSQMPTISLKGTTLRVTLATTTADRERGLGGRTGLASDEGMLFVFDTDGLYAFWMKDMKFSIDMVWLSSDGTVVYMAKNVSPDTYPAAFTPDTPARYVLELPAGWADAHGLKVGDKASL